jgi:hypothetical protein
MFDRGEFAIGNVRIARDLRRRRIGNRNHDARRRGDAGNIDVVDNLSNIGSVDILRNAGHVRIVGNVRLRLKQHCCIVESNVNVADSAGRRRSNRNSVGILRDRQSWS